MVHSGDTADALDHYTRAHPHFRAEPIPALLEAAVRRGPSTAIADLGCGDGWLVWALVDQYLAGDVIYAVDLSPERVRRAVTIDARVQGVVADATDVRSLPDASIDGIIVSQVIEHLADDRMLVPEIARLLRPGGWWYVGSILRGPRAWWIYRGPTGRRLDPTHEREYASTEAFAAALDHPELEIETLATRPVRFPVIDLGLRGAAAARLLKPERLGSIYGDRPRLAQLRRVRVRAPGYHVIEAVGRRLGTR
jgi:SAM-dependent methyltransferase